MEQVKKPGVEIAQVITGTTPTASSPNLIPCIVGPAYEVVELLSNDGTPNKDAKLVNSENIAITYNQVPVSISYTDFPTPHADSSQMSVLPNEVNVGLYSGNSLSKLNVRPSSAFLSFANKATRAGLFIWNRSDPSKFKLKLNIAFDQRVAANVSDDVKVNLDESSLDLLVAKLNEAIAPKGATASKAVISGKTGILIKSGRFGASSSITLRKVSTSTSADHAFWGLDNNKSYRVTGAGFKAEDNPIPSANTSSYVTFAVETAMEGTTLSDTSSISTANLITVWTNDSGDESQSAQAQLTFNSSSATSIPLVAATPTSDGDTFYTKSSFGTNVAGVQVIQVEPTRFKIGTVDNLKSIYDASGNAVYQRYIEYPVYEIEADAFFAPKNAYFIASNLVSENPDSTYAELVGSIKLDNYVAAESASVELTCAYPIDGSVGTSLRVVSSFDDGVVIQSSDETIQITSDYATVDDLVAGLSQALADVTVAKVNATTFSISNKLKGVSGSITVSGSYLAIFGENAPISDIGVDESYTGLSGKELQLSFNGSTEKKSVTASSDSLTAFVKKINEVCGFDASSCVDGEFSIKTYLKGHPGSVTVYKSTIADILGFSSLVDSIALGTGRPNPDLFVASNGSIVIGGDILRNTLTGKPVNQPNASIYIEYRALRLDLSAVATQPGVIKVSSISDLGAVYGPISVRNPLALGLYFAMINAGDGVEITGLGVSDISDAEPDGTALAYLEAVDLLKSHEVYSIVPLSQSEQVIEIVDKHVKDMSQPALRAERVLISSPVNPIRRNPTVVLSGDTAENTSVLDQIDLNDTPEAALGSYGVDTSSTIPFELSNGKQLYITISFGDDVRNYSVISVDGARVTVRRTLTEAQMADGFYSTDSLPASFSSASFSLQLRGTLLKIVGSNKLDKTAYAQTIRDKAQQYSNRRQLRLYPDQVQAVIAGVDTALPSVYYACAIAGACSTVAPQEPFTRRRLVGFTDVIGPALENSHYDIISAGNSVIEVDSPGEVPALRIQATTDVSTIESREWSITKAVDFFSKVIRGALRRRVGLFNITQAYIDDLSTLLDGACNGAVNSGLFKSASVAKLEQDKNQPDTLIVSIQVEVLYPANYIQLTIVI
jgi:hypothetical protein